MHDIGNKLKEKREENGVSIEEAAEDLKMRPSQIISLEEGKKDDFKDVVFLKYFIRDYAKYLGLDGEKLVDEFNEFLFDDSANKNILEEVIYSICLSIRDNYSVKEVVFTVNGKEIIKSVIKNIE